MTNREALLAAIADAPEEDTPRLVYADFLDETGNPNDIARAKLIRTQVTGARCPAGSSEKRELDKLAQGLWETHKSAWFPGVSSSKLPFPARGFIDSWGCYSAEEIANPDVPFTTEPIASLTLSVDSAEELRGAENWVGLARIRELKLWPGTTDDPEMVRFLSSPHLTGLRKLWIMGNRLRPWSPMPEAVRILAAHPQYGTVTELTIEHAEVGNAGAVALAKSTTLRPTSVSLSQCEIGLAGLRELFGSPLISRVAHLGLGGIARTSADGETLAEALGNSNHLIHLESLGLDETAFTDRAAALLARANWPSLKRLTILPHDMNHSDENNGLSVLTGVGIASLVAASWATQIEWLDLSGQTFGDAGAEALAQGRRLARLRQLTLMGTGFTATGLRAITDAYSRQLEHLQIAHNPIGDAGAAVIAEAAWPKMVPLSSGQGFEEYAGQGYEQRGLFIARCDIGEAGAKALLHSSTIPRDIPDVFLGDAMVSKAVVARLKARYPNTTVQF